MFKHLLVPTDGTELSTDTISRAIEFARSIGAKITFFYATPDYMASLVGDGALLASLSPELYAERYGGQERAILAKAEIAARAAGVQCESRGVISDHPHQAILQTASELGCDLIFMASHGPRSIGGMMLGSETLKVLSQTRIPVLVSSVERNDPTPAKSRALAIIRDEHRSLAVVTKGIQYLMDELRAGRAPDVTLLRAMIFYVREFPDRLHHPKEDEYLFPKLLARTQEVDATIAELKRQHAEDGSLLDAIDKALDRYEAYAAEQVAEMIADAVDHALDRYESPLAREVETLIAAVDTFATAQWKHMSLEETVVLPAAATHLLAEDWEAIAAASAENNDPNFGPDAGDKFARLFSRIVNLAPAGA